MNKRCVNQIIMIKRMSTDQSQVNYFLFIFIFQGYRASKPVRSIRKTNMINKKFNYK